MELYSIINTFLSLSEIEPFSLYPQFTKGIIAVLIFIEGGWRFEKIHTFINVRAIFCLSWVRYYYSDITRSYY